MGNRQAWISFKKIPYLKYYDINVPKFLRPLGVRKYNREFQDIFPLENNGNYYQNENSSDHQIRIPDENTFTGNIYLLVSDSNTSSKLNKTVRLDQVKGGRDHHVREA